MEAWVYLFSQFTTEGLLVESFLIFLLCCGYTAYWIMKKRREGAIKSEVPASVVKVYLNELITDAEELRSQLFGLLYRAGAMPERAERRPAPKAEAAAPAAGPADAELVAKLTDLQGKLEQQDQALELMMVEKDRIEKELAAAKAAGTGPSAASSGKSDEVVRGLKQKISGLEEKLAEYSVIEDDLANLKRLQQENAQLKGMLEGKGIQAPAAAAPAPAPAAKAAPPPPEPMPEPAPEPAAEAAEPAFEEMVDKVEETIAAAPAEVEPAPPPVAAKPQKKEEAAPPSTAKPAADKMDKTDEDLLSEFEKMLNS